MPTETTETAETTDPMTEILDRRRAELESMESCDLLIVGGGVTGAGIAREAAYRGLSVLLAEKDDFASGTSSRSSKLVHGGLRYLEQFELRLVFEATRERSTLMRIAPHLVRPLKFIYPVYEGGTPGMPLLAAAMALYDSLSLFRSPRLHRLYGEAAAHRVEPLLRNDGLTGAAQYFDGATDDARLTLETILGARLAKAVCLNHLETMGIEEAREASGSWVTLRCRLTGTEKTIQAGSIVLAVGPWTDRVRSHLGLPNAERPLLRTTRGSHLVVDRARLPLAHALVMSGHGDARVTFAIPWDERVIIGTSDIDDDAPPEQVRASAEEVAYLLQTANSHLPSVQLRRDDVISTYSGLRPLIREEGQRPSEVSREHEIVEEKGVVIVAGGKLTTYRSMAEEVVDRVVRTLADRGAVAAGRPLRPLRRSAIGRLADRWSELADGEVMARRGTTARRILPGAVGLTGARGPKRVMALLSAQIHDSRTVQHLVRRYGGRSHQIAALCRDNPELSERIVPDLPVIWAEIPFAAQRDLARSLIDVLDRRTALALRDRSQGTGAAPRAADILSPLLGWDASERKRQIDAYGEHVARSCAWREE
ncbi:MAG: glycerol-3-phosphate dehydrogenase [Gemmatimonadetes bacterium]|nr:glycerol-3-phosphate dehydrogenase [Gemmatimonadota bacterium]